MSQFFYVVLCFASLVSFAEQSGLQNVVDTQNQSHKEASSSQNTINKLDDETQSLLQSYRFTLKQIENTKKYNEQLRLFIKNQKLEQISLRQQIEQVKHTGRNILPLISRMIESLENFVRLDIPFLFEKRMQRITKLKELITRSDVSISEKYRRLLNIYEIESEYGRTISTYKGIQKIDGKDLNVSFLQIGRVAFIYQSLDKKYQGYWDSKQSQWVKLSSSYTDSVNDAIAIANKQMAPDLLKMPIAFPQEI